MNWPITVWKAACMYFIKLLLQEKYLKLKLSCKNIIFVNSDLGSMVALLSWYDGASTKMARIVFVLNTKTQIITFITFIAILYTLDKVVTLCKLQKTSEKIRKIRCSTQIFAWKPLQRGWQQIFDVKMIKVRASSNNPSYKWINEKLSVTKIFRRVFSIIQNDNKRSPNYQPASEWLLRQTKLWIIILFKLYEE